MKIKIDTSNVVLMQSIKQVSIDFKQWCETSDYAESFYRNNRHYPKRDGSHHSYNQQNDEKLFDYYITKVLKTE
jgi:pectin methylesterase-like acyl-CoA thioesterase